jgi:hypothetical protein
MPAVALILTLARAMLLAGEEIRVEIIYFSSSFKLDRLIASCPFPTIVAGFAVSYLPAAIVVGG